MKVKVITDSEVDDEIIIRCKTVTPDLEKLVQFLESKNQRMECINEQNQKVYINPMDVYYIESIDGITFIYTIEKVYKTRSTLQQFEENKEVIDYFRGAKNLIINIQHVKCLRSQLNGRIIVTMNNTESLVVSRHYARLLKEKLKGEK